MKAAPDIKPAHSQSLPELRRCYDCGQPMGRKDIYCPRCGAKQPREPRRESARR